MQILLTTLKSPATRRFAAAIGRTAATAVAEHVVSQARAHLDTARAHDARRGR